MTAYVGSYENAAYGRVEVSQWLDTGHGEDDGQAPSAHLTLVYGFATWDLLQLPESPGPSNNHPPSPPHGSEHFYGKGRNVTAWVDYSPFVFHPPPPGSDVIVELSVPGFEKLAPPVFTRVGWATSGGSGPAAGCWSLLLAAVTTLAWVLWMK